MYQIGAQLRHLRQTRKQTLADVGAATDLSIGYLSKIERSLTEPTLGTLDRLSKHFDVSVSHFLDQPDSSNKSAAHLPSFHEFVERMNGQVEASMQSLLLQVDAHAEKPARSVEAWLRYYYVISAITTSNN